MVENKAGATGTIGAGTVARAAPDGTRCSCRRSGPSSSRRTSSRCNYDALKDLDPVSVVVQAPNVLVVPAGARTSRWPTCWPT
jgi:tripartite-type tricarboxylate transporter receptor subunit TctC